MQAGAALVVLEVGVDDVELGHNWEAAEVLKLHRC